MRTGNKQTEPKKENTSEKETVIPKGIFVNDPHEKAPEWVLGSLAIDVNTFSNWLMDQTETEKEPEKYVRFDILRSKEGKPYLRLNTFKKGE